MAIFRERSRMLAKARDWLRLDGEKLRADPA